MFLAAHGLLDGLLYLVGAAVLVALVRRLPPGLSWRRGSGYALLVLAFYGPALLGPATHVATDIAYQWRPWSETLAEGEAPVEMANPLLSDIPFQMLPFRTLVRERFLDGEVPLWAHEMNAGQPLLGNGQSAPFAPLHLAALPVPPARALTVAAAWQTLVGLLLMHLLVLAVGARAGPAAEWGATVGAVAFALSTYAVAWAYHPLGMVAMGVPGVVLGILHLARGTRGGFSLLVAVAVSMAVSGHPETVAHTALLSAGLAVGLLVRPPTGREAPGRGRFVGLLAGAAVLSALLAAPALLPLAETLPASERMEILDKAPRVVAPPVHEAADWLPTFQPLAFGSPRYHDTEADYRGRSNFNELCSQYAGALTLVLALVGALVLRGRVLAIVLAGLGSLLVSFRVEPLYSAFEILPVVGHAAHGRLRLFWVLAVALAAGVALPRLLETRRRRTALAVGVAVLAIAIALVPPPVADGGSGELGAVHPRLWFALVLAGLGLFAAALGLSLTERPQLAPRRLAAGAALLLGAELFVLGVVYHPLTPPALQLDPPPALAFILDRNAEALARHQPFRVLAEGADLVPNLAAAQGLWDPRSSNDPARPFEATWLLGRRLSQGQWQRSQATLLEGHYDAPFHQMLGVRYVLTRHREPLGPPYRPVFDHQGGKVWELDGALPLFWVPERVDAVDRLTARRRAVRNRNFEARGTVTVEDGTPPTADAQQGAVEIARIHGNGFDLTTRSAGPVVVASSVVLVPGWRVTIDGESARPVAVNWIFLGFEVPAGEHRVELTYSPAGWRWGLVLFGVGVMVVVILVIRRRRTSPVGNRSPEPSGPSAPPSDSNPPARPVRPPAD